MYDRGFCCTKGGKIELFDEWTQTSWVTMTTTHDEVVVDGAHDDRHLESRETGSMAMTNWSHFVTNTMATSLARKLPSEIGTWARITRPEVPGMSCQHMPCHCQLD